MTRKEIIDGLKFTVDMFLFDTSTGETFTEPRNDMDKITIDACRGAIELLEQTDGDLISRTDLLNKIWQKEYGKDYDGVNLLNISHIDIIEQMPSTTPVIVSDIKFYDDYKAELDIIKQMPSVEKTAEWIPVKERKPKFNDIVLASTNSDYDELRVVLTVYKADEFWFNGAIKAWMPLPEPYKEESE